MVSHALRISTQDDCAESEILSLGSSASFLRSPSHCVCVCACGGSIRLRVGDVKLANVAKQSDMSAKTKREEKTGGQADETWCVCVYEDVALI